MTGRAQVQFARLRAHTLESNRCGIFGLSEIPVMNS
jgi:hypothetical protein